MLGHDGSGQRKQPDVLEFGRDRRANRWRAPHLLLVLLVIGTGLVVYVRATGHQASPPHPTPAPPTAPAPPPIRVILAGHRLLGIRAGWQLFARGPDDLLRIQLDQGRMTWTYVPPLATTNPAVALFVTAHEALIRPADLVPAYVVPDGGQAKLVTGPLATIGPMLPGRPGSQTAWITAGPPHSPGLALVTLSGHKLGTRIRFPPGSPLLPATAVPDGRGDVLVTSTSSAIYDAGPGWDRAVPGTVVAVGRSSWLTVTCPKPPGSCRYQVIDIADSSRRLLPGSVATEPYYFGWPPVGVIAPDGRTAAVLASERGSMTTVHLVSLRSGTSTDLGVRVGSASGYQQTMVWSPDSRWLFVASAGGKLVAINARTGRAQPLGLKLPQVEQVAIRP